MQEVVKSAEIDVNRATPQAFGNCKEHCMPKRRQIQLIALYVYDKIYRKDVLNRGLEPLSCK